MRPGRGEVVCWAMHYSDSSTNFYDYCSKIHPMFWKNQLIKNLNLSNISTFLIITSRKK